jgi:FKBP-type peptidyl-prolyl cis-trans isomerase FkpA
MSVTKVIVFVVIAVALIFAGISFNRKSDEKAKSEALGLEQEFRNAEKIVMEKFKINDIKLGAGDEARTGAKVKVNYLGVLEDGTKFDSSYDRNEPFEFTLGAGQVIRGWDIGVAGMKVGGKRELVIPPELGYGANQVGPIPPNSTLKFTVELLEVNNSN